MTSVSLLASATVLPVRIAAIVGRRPAPPTMAESTMSASTSAASVTSPAAPRKISGRGCGRARATASAASASDSASTRGRCFAHSATISSGVEPRAAIPSTLNSSGN